MFAQAHCCVWKHHLRVGLGVPGGFPPRGQGRCGCGCRLPSPRRARPRVRGSAEEAAHQGQVFPGEDPLSRVNLYHGQFYEGIPDERHRPGESQGARGGCLPRAG